MTLTKSVFMQGHQCHKLLWLSRHRPEVCVQADTQRTTEGNEVGDLAMTYFGAYTEVPLGQPQQMATITQSLIAAGTATICEASFQAEDLFCSADIVRQTASGLEVYEVKSTTHVKPEHLDDMGFQLYTIEAAGYHVSKFSIMYLNGNYVRDGALDVHALFSVQDCTQKLREALTDTEHTVMRCRSILTSFTEPEAELSCACENPYECPCKAYCYQLHHVPERSVFNIAGMTATKKYDLYAQGIVTVEQCIRTEAALTERQLVVAESIQPVAGVDAPQVDSANLATFIHSLQYPLNFLDFETCQFAVPKFQGTKPFEQIPFQYSLHRIERPGGELLHFECLAPAGEDPRPILAAQLCKDIPDSAMTMAYNDRFENSVLRNLANFFPKMSASLNGIADNLIDLMLPFQKRWVFTRSMQGSYSIKKVLPALCGTDPDLDYHALPGVQNGGEAMGTYATLHLIQDPAEVARIRTGLLLYCGLDTLAMVKILDKLQHFIGVCNPE